MKTLFTLLLLLMTLGVASQEKTVDKPKIEVVNDSIVKSGVKYKLHTGSRGGKYIIRTSRKGTQYKQYFKTTQLKIKGKGN